MKKSNATIKEFREEYGLTQSALAKMMNVGANYIYLMESGTKPVSKKTIEFMDKVRDNPDLLTIESNAKYDRYPVNLNKEETSPYKVVASDIDLLRTQLAQAYQREKDLMDIIKHLMNGKQP